MKYDMMPVIEAGNLQDALELQFGPEVMGDNDILARILFSESYGNDCYKSYYFRDMEVYEGKSWQDEEHIRIRNCVNSILQDLFPDHERVLIDVSW